MNDAIAEATAQLRAAGIESARLEARLLWEHALKLSLSPIGGEGRGEGDSRNQSSEVRDRNGMRDISDSRFLASQSQSPPHPNPLPQWGRGNVVENFESLIARRLAHEPIAYITGEKEFWSLDFKVGPGCLIPRPETETLVQEAVREFPDHLAPLNILDLGTGSGCLLVSLLVNYPNARGIGVDVSAPALRWARANAERHGVASRSALIQTDWSRLEPGAYDVVLANPPYVASEELRHLSPDVRDHEPAVALDGGPDGLAAYRALAPLLRNNLTRGGRAFLEIGRGQHHIVASLLESTGLEMPRIVEDLAGIPRCLAARAGPDAQGRSK